MKTKILLSLLLVSCSIFAIGQSADSSSVQMSTAEEMMQQNSKLVFGGYGEVHYNKSITKNTYELGTFDVHRIVLFNGYNFSKKTHFVSEIEFEYTNELWVEQAYLQHQINKYVNFRAGLLLIPMGIINEFHEPTTFNGVERPLIDNKIAPSTWREVGFGFTGNILPISLKYQIYAVNGFTSYDTKGLLNGSKGIRDGRQKGSKAYTKMPDFTGRVEYFGIKNLTIGLSAYSGQSESKLYSKLNKDSLVLNQKADSSVVDFTMLGFDTRYKIKGFDFRAQVYYAQLGNTEKYNVFTRQAGKQNDLGSAMLGYYAELGYNVLKLTKMDKYELIPFVRYEFYNTHHSVDKLTTKNDAYHNTLITTGLTLKLDKGAVVKSDIQLVKPKSSGEFTKTINLGIGINF